MGHLVILYLRPNELLTNIHLVLEYDKNVYIMYVAKLMKWTK